MESKAHSDGFLQLHHAAGGMSFAGALYKLCLLLRFLVEASYDFGEVDDVSVTQKQIVIRSDVQDLEFLLSTTRLVAFCDCSSENISTEFASLSKTQVEISRLI